MDQRQAQIRERAGLEEGKINEDFVEFLKKYGVWVLVLVIVLGGGTYLKRWYAENKEKKIDNAFSELEATSAGSNPSPDALVTIADSYGSYGAVGTMARLRAADAYLGAVRRGVKVGSEVDAQGALKNADDALTDADRESYLTKAREQYQMVVDESRSDARRVLATLGGLYGLAAVAESNRDFAKAKGYYEQIVQLAGGTTYSAQAVVAKQRIEDANKIAAVTKLLPKAELPDLPAVEVPAPSAVGQPALDFAPVQLPGAAPADGSQPVTNPATNPATPPVTAPPATTAPATAPPATEPAAPK